jgi:hypothetical protein
MSASENRANAAEWIEGGHVALDHERQRRTVRGEP